MSIAEIELQQLRREMDELKSKDEIRQQVVRYARALDWLDESLLKEVYHDDAFVDFGFFKGIFRDYWPGVMEHEGTHEATFHLCSTVQIELQGDTAEVESYGIAVARNKGVVAMFGGRYLDRFERRNGVWKIARRVYLLDWNLEHRGADQVEEFLSGLNILKDRSPTHELYRRLGAGAR